MSNYLVSRLQPSVPLVLNSKDEVDMFLDGELPKLAKTVTDIAVVGMFLDKNDKGKCLFIFSQMYVSDIYIDLSPKVSQSITTRVKTVNESIFDILFHAIRNDFSFILSFKP